MIIGKTTGYFFAYNKSFLIAEATEEEFIF